jgi:pimeloyl-ACP methyl ester carboxylesterase
MQSLPQAPDMSARKGRSIALLLPLLVAFVTGGCGSFVAHRMAQAPNTYPSWLSPRAHVFLSFDDRFLTNFPAQFAEVGPPPARLHHRVVEPAEYQFGVTCTNWLRRGKREFKFSFHAEFPGRTNAWTGSPRGTVVLLHGYGLAEFSMAPWALRLAQEGWRCVLVDVRGHGKSTGRKVYFGVQEAQDLSQLLDVLSQAGELSPPVAALGESYGAALALRWKAMDPRIDSVVAMSPYPVLSNAVLSLSHEYARFFPRKMLQAGLKQLPAVLGVAPEELDPSTVLARHPVVAMFVTGTEDKITPLADVQKLFEEALPGSRLIAVPEATHETLPYRFSELVPPVLVWLSTNAPNQTRLLLNNYDSPDARP